MKMAIVGCEASGKTVFMCALADYYGIAAASNPLRLKLTPENAAANSFERFQFRQMRTLRQWPPATPPERTIEMKWTLRRKGEPLAEIDMLEFGGETYRAAFRGDADAATRDKSSQELLRYLSSAEFFVVLVSIKALLADPKNVSEADFNRETEALWVTRGILDFIRKNRPNAGVVIGLTQADKYRNELAEAGGPQQLLAQHWSSVVAAHDTPVVEVASVSKTDVDGNPAENYNTRGVLPVMQAFSRHCFGDENALENGAGALDARRRNASLAHRLIVASLSAVALGALASGLWNLTDGFSAFLRFLPVGQRTATVEKIVTNRVETIVERPVTNTVEKLVETIVERPVTNTVEKIVEKVVEQVIERPVTNTIEKVVEKIIDRPVTNTIERIVEKVVEKVVTNTIEKAVRGTPSSASTAHAAKEEIPSGYRVWTDYNGHTIVARWLGVAPDGKGITLLTRKDRRIEAVLWKFSAADQTFVKEEVRRHTENGEILVNGVWVKNPILK